MIKERIPETSEGIQDTITVEMYDLMQRSLRDRGWMETKDLLKSGITAGHALEIGPGPGYLGLEWLKRTTETSLTGLDISPAMLRMAEKNAEHYGLEERTEYIEGNSMDLPFGDDTFDAVLSNGSLHEWEHPERVLKEIARVLKPRGRYFISDLRRDMNSLLFVFMWLGTRPREMRPGLVTSYHASYSEDELMKIASLAGLSSAHIHQTAFGLSISGEKE